MENPAETIARSFHTIYEAMAPYFGYATRRESAVQWTDVPWTNRDLMIETVQRLLDADVIRPGD